MVITNKQAQSDLWAAIVYIILQTTEHHFK